MIRRYGVGESYIDEAGNECKVLFSLRDGVPPRLVARHYAEIGVGYIEGKKFIHYRALKGTSEYTAAEMAAFLDGIIAECEEQGIQTAPPEKTAQYKEAKKPWPFIAITAATKPRWSMIPRSMAAASATPRISAETAAHM